MTQVSHLPNEEIGVPKHYVAYLKLHSIVGICAHVCLFLHRSEWNKLKSKGEELRVADLSSCFISRRNISCSQ